MFMTWIDDAKNKLQKFIFGPKELPEASLLSFILQSI